MVAGRIISVCQRSLRVHNDSIVPQLRAASIHPGCFRTGNVPLVVQFDLLTEGQDIRSGDSVTRHTPLGFFIQLKLRKLLNGDTIGGGVRGTRGRLRLQDAPPTTGDERPLVVHQSVFVKRSECWCNLLLDNY